MEPLTPGYRCTQTNATLVQTLITWLTYWKWLLRLALNTQYITLSELHWIDYLTTFAGYVMTTSVSD